jgi:hypothetical protein
MNSSPNLKRHVLERLRGKIMLAILVTFQSAALPATTGWRTERDQITCQINRDVPASDRAEWVTILRDAISTTFHVTLIVPRTVPITARSRLTMVRPGDAGNSALAFKRGRLADGRAVLEFDTPVDLDPTFSFFLDGQQLAIVGDELPALRSRLARCREDQLVGLGVEAASVSDTLQPPVGSVRPWITNDDIPPRPLPKSRRGYMMWKLLPDGRINNCRFVISLDDEKLDRRVCELLTRRGAYQRGARDAAGQPVETWDSRWMIVVY